MAEGIVDPQPGATLDGAVQVFRWDLGGIPIEASWLYAGSTVGGSQYGSRATAAFTVTSLGDLPTDGSPVLTRLWYRTGGAWRFVDQRYVAADEPGLPAIVEPADGATLRSGTQIFRWDFAGLEVESSWLYVGSTEGGSEYLAVLTGTATSTTVDRLPTDGATIHVRLYFQVAAVWYHVDHRYQAATVAVPTLDELTRELQRLVGVTDDGIVGPNTRAALNRNWVGRPDSFDPSFASRFSGGPELVRWVQRRMNTRGRFGLIVDGIFGPNTEAAATTHLGKRGVVAVESFLELLSPGSRPG